jgi:predicted nucleic acid-binding protein
VDKQWSLVDATSFLIMSSLEITSALTNDRHFEQAGFMRLLKP